MGTRFTFKSAVCEGLGYCCPFAFFKFGSKQTGMIAARTDLTDRCVRYNKEKFRNKVFVCEKLESCLKEKLR